MPSKSCSQQRVLVPKCCHNGKTFLQQSVVKSREFTASFQASESAHQQGVQAARYAVKRAQQAFGLASKREQAGNDGPYTISDSEDNDAADEAMEDPHGESVQRVQDGMSYCDQLEELSSTANGDAVNASAALPFGVACVV